jgi:hypothetical protein
MVKKKEILVVFPLGREIDIQIQSKAGFELDDWVHYHISHATS